MDTKEISDLLNMFAESNNDMDSRGVLVRFSKSASQLDDLQIYIEEAIKNASRQMSKRIDDYLKSQEKKNEKTQNNNDIVVKGVKKLVKSKQIDKELGKKLLDELEKSRQEQVEKNKFDILDREDNQSKFTKLIGHTTRLVRLVSYIHAAVSPLINTLLDHSKNRISFVTDLNEKGVKLIEGFDNSFNELSNMTGKAHADFVKLMTDNSKMVVKLNAIGMSGARELSQMAGAVVGKWGITGKEQDAILKHVTENQLEFATLHELQTMNYVSSMENATKHLVALSAATGKSVEELIHEREERQKNFLHRRLQKDERTKDRYNYLAQAGASPAAIEYILLGKMSDEVAQLMADPGQRRYLQEARRAHLESKNDDVFFKNLSYLITSDLAESLRKKKKRNFMPVLYALDDQVLLRALAFSDDLPLSPLDFKRAMEAKAGGTKEQQLINSMVTHDSILNQLHNDIAETLTPSIDNLTNVLKVSNWVTGLLGEAVKNPAVATAAGIIPPILKGAINFGMMYLLAKKAGLIATGAKAAVDTAQLTLPGILSTTGTTAASTGLLSTAGILGATGTLIGATGVVGSSVGAYNLAKKGNTGTALAVGGLGGALSGALAGASAGLLFGGWGAIPGAIGGAIIGALGGLGGAGYGWLNSEENKQTEMQQELKYGGSSYYSEVIKPTIDREMLSLLGQISKDISNMRNDFNLILKLKQFEGIKSIAEA